MFLSGNGVVNVPAPTLSLKGSVVDLTAFSPMLFDEECRGDADCAAIDRLVQSLDLWADLESKEEAESAQSAFTSFCDLHYGDSNVVRDYIHFVDHHSEQETVRKIAERLRVQCRGVSECGDTLRHFRRRSGSRRDEEEEDAVNFYLDTMHSLHFYLCHLEEMGLRVPAELLQTETERKAVDEEQDEGPLVDAVIKRMAQHIAKRRNLLTVQRLDGSTNTKFNICTVSKHEKGI